MTQRTTHYHLLGLPRDATLEEVRLALRAAAKLHHPDAPGGSADAFSALTEAAAVLSDAAQRKLYDQHLSSKFWKCPACDGTGITMGQRGFTRFKNGYCAPCKGTGVSLEG